MRNPQSDAGGKGDAGDGAEREGEGSQAWHFPVIRDDQTEHQGFRAEADGERQGSQNGQVGTHGGVLPISLRWAKLAEHDVKGPARALGGLGGSRK